MKKVLSVLDREQALELTAGNEKLAQELLQLLLKELPQYKIKLQQAVTDENRHELHALLHKMHGGLRYVGAPSLTEIVGATDANLNNLSLKDLQQNCHNIEVEIDRVIKQGEY